MEFNIYAQGPQTVTFKVRSDCQISRLYKHYADRINVNPAALQIWCMGHLLRIDRQLQDYGIDQDTSAYINVVQENLSNKRPRYAL